MTAIRRLKLNYFAQIALRARRTWIITLLVKVYDAAINCYIHMCSLILLLASTATTAAEAEVKLTSAATGTQMNMSATCTSLVSKVSNGNTVSCVIELKTVWFNFAAPPRTPITRKIDYTRLDWNLLSTASPAINAWMNPSNKFAIRIVHMFRTMYRRSTAIVACLMAEALDVQGIHMPQKVYMYI